MSETRTISIPVYRDPEGRPVCMNAFGVRHCCRLFVFGAGGNWCAFSGRDIKPASDGIHRPTPNCPLWRDDLTNKGE